ncbi:dienelactone hydrolase family protein [Daejeonella sp.]|jgi:putative phosphoribosyl transferase|uniref:dienelactone hydrolase family protein n=1 Tax=Daejeonella sp. TaxID=2805397 RepID=UPI0037831EAB
MEMRYNNEVSIPVGEIRLKGILSIPEDCLGIVVFSHGSGSSRLSKRNQYVAEMLQKKGFGTLLFDLLTPEEDLYYLNRFEIEMLHERLIAATKWLQKHPSARDLGIAYFGASTGAASALMAAAKLPEVFAVVSRGGRPDLAIDVMPDIKVACLFIVGSLDTEVLSLNQKAFEKLNGEKHLEVVQGASHLFEEEGKLQQVAELASSWFKSHLPVLTV